MCRGKKTQTKTKTQVALGSKPMRNHPEQKAEQFIKVSVALLVLCNSRPKQK